MHKHEIHGKTNALQTDTNSWMEDADVAPIEFSDWFLFLVIADSCKQHVLDNRRVRGVYDGWVKISSQVDVGSTDVTFHWMRRRRQKQGC